MKIILAVVVIISYKFITNFIAYLNCRRLSEYYRLWLSDKKEDFPTYKRNVMLLFKKANIKDSSIPATQKIGYGKIASFKASSFDNFPSAHQDFVSDIFFKFEEALGVFRLRMLDSINPLYWIESLLFAPKHLLEYFGLNLEKSSSKIINSLLLCIWWLFGIFWSIFHEQAISFVLDFFKNCHQ